MRACVRARAYERVLFVHCSYVVVIVQVLGGLRAAPLNLKRTVLVTDNIPSPRRATPSNNLQVAHFFETADHTETSQAPNYVPVKSEFRFSVHDLI